jgi:vacuolar-type H+-ATPase subunit E/Vma4
MSLDTILQALEAEAERQLAAIEQAGTAEIAALEAETETEAAQLRQEQLTAIRLPLKTEQTRRINRARLEALQIILAARESMLAEALAAARLQLADFSHTPAYGELLKQLAREAVAALGVEQPVHFLVRPTDVSLMQLMAGPDAQVAADSESPGNGALGGLIAVTSDGRIRVVNTLEVRFARAARRYRSQLAEWLFGNDE